MKKCYLALFLCLALPPVPAQSAENTAQTGFTVSLVEIVVTAARSETKLKEVPAKVELITGEDIQGTVGRTLTEQLKRHSLVLINCRPAGAPNLATILSDNIERIEILKGPASSLYGGEAMGGVVHIISKMNTEALTGMVELGLGSFSTNFQKAALGGGLGDIFDFDISAGRYDQIDNFKMGDGDTRANTNYRTRNGELRLGADIGSTWKVDLKGDTFDGETTGAKDMDRYGVDLKVAGNLSTNNTLSLTAYKTNEQSESYNNYIG